MKGDISFGGDLRPRVIRGSGHKGWRRVFVLIRDWLRRGR
jgi:hypothetical protein